MSTSSISPDESKPIIPGVDIPAGDIVPPPIMPPPQDQSSINPSQPAPQGDRGPGMSAPELAPPSGTSIPDRRLDFNLVVTDMNEALNSIVDSQLSGWIKNQKEIAKRIQEKINSPEQLNKDQKIKLAAVQEMMVKQQGEVQTELKSQNSQAAKAEAQIIDKVIKNLNLNEKSLESIREIIKSGQSSGEALNALLVQSAFKSEQITKRPSEIFRIPLDKISKQNINEEIMVVLSTIITRKKSPPVEKEKEKSAIEKQSEIPKDKEKIIAQSAAPIEPAKIAPLLQAAAMIPVINLMLNTLVYQTSWEVSGAIPKKEKPKEVNQKTALEFAKKVIKLIKDMGNTSQPSTAQTFFKLVLAASALSLINIAEGGKMIPEEFQSLIKPGAELPKNYIAALLVEIIRQQLGNLKNEEKMQILEGFYEFLDSGPEPHKMLEPVHVFRRVLGNMEPFQFPTGTV